MIPPFPTPRTQPFDAFVAQARVRPQIWRLVLGLVLVVAVYILFSMAVFSGGEALAQALNPDWSLRLWTLSSRNAEPTAVAVFLATLSSLILGVWLSVRVLHKRSLRSVIGPAGFQPGAYLKGAAVVVALFSPFVVISAFFTPLLPGQPLLNWIWWAVPALLLLAAQTAGEELVFRGYLQQQLAARFNSRWMWWVLPSVLFGAAHWDGGTFGPNAWLVVADATLMGLIAADLTARHGNLSLAMGLHLGNNLFALLVVSLPGPLSGLALFIADVDLGDIVLMRTALLGNMGILITAYVLYLVVFARRGT